MLDYQAWTKEEAGHARSAAGLENGLPSAPGQEKEMELQWKGRNGIKRTMQGRNEVQGSRHLRSPNLYDNRENRYEKPQHGQA